MFVHEFSVSLVLGLREWKGSENPNRIISQKLRDRQLKIVMFALCLRSFSNEGEEAQLLSIQVRQMLA